MLQAALLLWALVQPALAGEAELLVERARAALRHGEAPAARELATRAVMAEPSVAAWSVYLDASEAVGLEDVVIAALDPARARDGALNHAWIRDGVRDGRLEPDAGRELIATGDDGKIALAWTWWEVQRDPGAVEMAPDDPDDPDVARLRLEVTAVLGERRLAGVVARSWLRRHPDRPDVLAGLWAPSPHDEVLAPLRARLGRRLGRLVHTSPPDPLWLYRAWTALDAAGDRAGADAVAQRLVDQGLEDPRPAPDPKQELARIRAEVDALRAEERYDEAARRWEQARAQRDGFARALDHARLLAVVDRPRASLEVARHALRLALGPVPEDVALLDTAAHAARIADAAGAVAEAALGVGRVVTAREAAALARSVDPHPRWAALQAQTEVYPSAAEDPGLDEADDARVVARTLVDPTDGPGWVARARRHEAAGERDAAFVAWVVARSLGEEAGDALARTWTGLAPVEDAERAALDAFHAARRAHRQRLADLRDDAEYGAPIALSPVAPGPGLELPAWAATGLDGAPLTSSALAGGPYVLVVWASWCAPCLLELPEVSRRARALRDEGRPATVLAISVDDRQAVARRRADHAGWDGITVGWNPGFASLIGVDGLPTSFVVDGDGRIAHVERGFSPGGVERLFDALRTAE